MKSAEMHRKRSDNFEYPHCIGEHAPSPQQIAFCQVTIRNLEAETERKDSELAGLKDKVSDLIGAVNKLRKELEVKGQEILTVRREANTQVQLSGYQVHMTSQKQSRLLSAPTGYSNSSSLLHTEQSWTPSTNTTNIAFRASLMTSTKQKSCSSRRLGN